MILATKMHCVYNISGMFKNVNELKLTFKDNLTFHDPKITIHNPQAITPELVDKLTYTLVFSTDDSLKATIRRIIHELAKLNESPSSSIRPLYTAIGKGQVKGFTVPAMNIRMMTYDTARVMFRVAKKKRAAAFIIEIARTESEYTLQPPDEFATVILAAAIRENYRGPVFIQGDHCQFNAKQYLIDKEHELQRIKDWVTLLLHADFRNIDIDGSTLVDLTKPSLLSQQKDNAYVTAEMTKFIRSHEKKGGYVAIGGEIGHIGDKNSTVEEFEAFMHQYINKVARGSGISKVSVQTGTSHGGVISTAGKVQTMPVDFSVLTNIGKVAKEKYNLAGPVQHGASTLPMDVFHTFVQSHTVEIHLSTGFQNIVFETMPKELRDEIYHWAKKQLKSEWQTGWTEDQFLYKVRKKTWGPFKKHLWQLSDAEKQPIIHALEEYLENIYDQLNITGTEDIVKQYLSK